MSSRRIKELVATGVGGKEKRQEGNREIQANVSTSTSALRRCAYAHA